METKKTFIDFDTTDNGDLILYFELIEGDEQREVEEIIEKEDVLIALGYEIENGMVLSVQDCFNGEHYQIDHETPLDEISLDMEDIMEYLRLNNLKYA